MASPGDTIGTGTATPNHLAAADWPSQAADTLERVVGAVRDKTTGPIEHVTRILVFGLLATIVGTTALVLLTVGLVRVLAILADVLFDQEVWLAYVVAGGIFVAAGAFLWSKRTRRTVSTKK